MNSDLARLMLEWGALQYKMEKLAAQIQTAVLEIGETQTVGKVRADYRPGRRRYHYRKALKDAGLKSENLRTYKYVSTNYRAACRGLGVTEIPFTQGAPYVMIRWASK